MIFLNIWSLARFPKYLHLSPVHNIVHKSNIINKKLIYLKFYINFISDGNFNLLFFYRFGAEDSKNGIYD